MGVLSPHLGLLHLPGEGRRGENTARTEYHQNHQEEQRRVEGKRSGLGASVRHVQQQRLFVGTVPSRQR